MDEHLLINEYDQLITLINDPLLGSLLSSLKHAEEFLARGGPGIGSPIARVTAGSAHLSMSTGAQHTSATAAAPCRFVSSARRAPLMRVACRSLA